MKHNVKYFARQSAVSIDSKKKRKKKKKKIQKYFPPLRKEYLFSARRTTLSKLYLRAEIVIDTIDY